MSEKHSCCGKKILYANLCAVGIVSVAESVQEAWFFRILSRCHFYSICNTIKKLNIVSSTSGSKREAHKSKHDDWKMACPFIAMVARYVTK